MTGTAGESVTLAVRGDGRGGTLYAVRGAIDRGPLSAPSDWDASLLVGVIPAGATTYTATLPATWWKAGGYTRFLVAGNAVYDFKLASLSSTGKGDYWPPSNQNNGINDQGYQYIDPMDGAAAAKSCQSCPTLCDPQTAAHQAPPSLGFSRQEHWSVRCLPPLEVRPSSVAPDPAESRGARGDRPLVELCM